MVNEAAHSKGLNQSLKANSFSASQEIPQILWNVCSQDITSNPCSEHRMQGTSGQPYSPLKSFTCGIHQELNPVELVFIVILIVFHEGVMACSKHKLY